MVDQSARQTLIYEALRFANWAAGEGICPVDGQNVAAPEDFLMAYSNATEDEDWETIPERIATLSDAVQPKAERSEPVDATDAERLSRLLGPSVDGQVVVAALEDGDYADQPEWLWRNHTTGVCGFGRWSKALGQAPYIRADIALAALAASPPTSELEALRKRVAELEKEREWQPIETAPLNVIVDLWCIEADSPASWGNGCPAGEIVRNRHKSEKYGWFGNQSNDGVPRGPAQDLIPVGWRQPTPDIPLAMVEAFIATQDAAVYAKEGR